MTLQHVVFRESEPGNKSLTVNGVDLSTALTPDAVIYIGAREVTTMRVSLVRVVEAEFVGEVRLREADVAALVAIGWTPPAEVTP